MRAEVAITSRSIRSCGDGGPATEAEDMLEHIVKPYPPQPSRSFNYFFMRSGLTLHPNQEEADESGLLPQGAATMLEITERTERESFPTLDQAPNSCRQALRSIRSKQIPAIGLLTILGLIPVAALVLSPESWHALPPGVQWAAYLASLIFLGAACSLIANPGDEHTSGWKQDSAESRKRRKQRRLDALSKDAFTHGA
jgi:hypothetical protein